MKTLNHKIILFTAFLGLTTACTDDFKSPATPSGQTIAQVATANDSFDILVAAATKTGLAASLNNNNAGEFTVFAPTDDAFVTYFRGLNAAYAAYTEANVLDLIETLAPSNTIPTLGALTGVLNYHIKISRVESSEISNGQVFVMQNGNRLSLSKVGADVVINANLTNGGAMISSDLADVEASNGIIHGINRVLTPSIGASTLATFGFTHTTSGTITLPVNYATIPPTINGGTTTDASLTNYNLLAAAIRRTGLAQVLFPNQSILPDFTIFAPTDQAFINHLSVANEAAGLTAINGLNGQALTDLGNVLRYHVLSGRVLSSDISNGQQAATLLSGASLTFGVSGSNVTVDDVSTVAPAPAAVTSANILSNTGVVHRIDRILLPN
jgi:uncharacterized surface protein with fasciclin (FAS1) repeats